MLLLLHDDDDNEVAAAEAAAPEPPADDGADGGTSRDWLLMSHSVRATATLVGDVAERPLLLRAAVIDYLAPFDAKKAAAFVAKRSCFRPDIARKSIDTIPPAPYAARFVRFSGELLALRAPNTNR